MHQAMQYAPLAIEAPYNQVKVTRVAMLVASPHGLGEQVCDLN